jgi:hypothetical protein
LIATFFFVSSCTGSKGPLPPGFEALHLQMPLAQLKQQRPGVHPDGPSRQYDPVGKIAFSVANKEVVGIRIFVAAPTDKLVLAYYSRNFAADRTEGHSYEIQGKPLKLYTAKNGLEVMYGVDPGSATGPANLPHIKEPKVTKNQARLVHGRGATLVHPGYYPVKRSSGGIDIWLHPIGDPLNGPVEMSILVGTGSSQEQDDSRGSSAVVGAIAIQNILELARSRHVSVEQLILRTTLIFSFRGRADDVSVVAQAFGRDLVSRATARSSDAQIKGAFSSSLRQAMGTNLKQRVLADEGFGAIFSASGFSPSPVSRGYSAPTEAIIKSRAGEINQAPVSIVVSGAIGPRYAYPIAEALGARKQEDRMGSPRPPLPNRESRKVTNPAVAIDGLWIKTSSIADIAQLFVARTLLEDNAITELRFNKALIEKPIAVIASGQVFASYLMMINAAAGTQAQAIGLASRSILSQLGQSIPKSHALEDMKQGTIAHLNRKWATPHEAVELMIDLKMLGVRIAWLPAIVDRIQKVTAEELKTFLGEHATAANTFSVRWGPNQ